MCSPAAAGAGSPAADQYSCWTAVASLLTACCAEPIVCHSVASDSASTSRYIAASEGPRKPMVTSSGSSSRFLTSLAIATAIPALTSPATTTIQVSEPSKTAPIATRMARRSPPLSVTSL